MDFDTQQGVRDVPGEQNSCDNCTKSSDSVKNTLVSKETLTGILGDHAEVATKESPISYKTEDNPEISNNYPNNNLEVAESASSSGTTVGQCQKVIASESLSNLMTYGSSSEDSDSAQSVYHFDSDAESEITQEGSCNGNYKAISTAYRENQNSDSTDEASDNEESSNDDLDDGARSNPAQASNAKSTATEGELGLDKLPPVPDLSKLNINIKEEDCIQMGNVTNIVDRLVTIQSLPNTPAYDLDTLLFLDKGKQPLGHIYDVLGPVTSPMYVVRFNSKQQIEAKGVCKGLPVYSAPDTEHTQYVFVKQLMKIKGSDASWKGDGEVPPEFLDFSDDEAEFAFSKQSLNEQDIFDNKRKRNSIEKHKMFEVAMNLKNKVDSARHKMRDTCEPTPKRFMPQSSHPGFFYHQPPNINQIRQCGASFTRFPPPSFPAPPPNFGGYMNMPMMSMNPFSGQFGIVSPFGPAPSFAINSPYGPPIIPPLPAMPAVMSQPPPTYRNLVLPPPNTSAMNIPKQPNVSKSPPKRPQGGGVVPKTTNMTLKRNSGLPKLYLPSPAEFHQYPPNLGLPKPIVPPFAVGAPPPHQGIPQSMPLPFGPPMPPWPYNISHTPMNIGNFRPMHGTGRQFKKQ